MTIWEWAQHAAEPRATRTSTALRTTRSSTTHSTTHTTTAINTDSGRTDRAPELWIACTGNNPTPQHTQHNTPQQQHNTTHHNTPHNTSHSHHNYIRPSVPATMIRQTLTPPFDGEGRAVPPKLLHAGDTQDNGGVYTHDVANAMPCLHVFPRTRCS